MRTAAIPSLIAMTLAALAAFQPAAGPSFTVPPGFVVDEVYAPAASGSVVAIAFDSRGRLVIARERGPVVRLLDPDPAGRFTREQEITAAVTNCQGLEFDGSDLLAACDDDPGKRAGLFRVPDADGDGAGEAPVLLARASDPVQEHGPHDVVFGPDGWFYWIFGNFSTLGPVPSPLSPYRNYREEQLLPTYTDPRGHPAARAPAGTIYRGRLRGTAHGWELVAGGFRNAYDMEFTSDGELLTFDSDMEWDIGLPWYRPVRTNHVVPGGEYGWRDGSGQWPEYYADSLPGLTNIGRGSPTGVTVYQHHVFPAQYDDAFFQADWSRGRILAGHLVRDGASYREESREFLLGTPLNVTDLEVGPDGALYFAKGGRRTEGGVYRVRYAGAPRATNGDRAGAPGTGSAAGGQPAGGWIDAVLRQPQHRSSWAREALRAAQRTHGAEWGQALLRAVRDGARPEWQRARALELLQVYGPAPELSEAAALLKDPSAELRAAAVYVLGQRPGAGARAAIAPALRDSEPLVRRRAAEALVRTGLDRSDPVPAEIVADLVQLLGDADRYVRFAARLALERVDRNLWIETVLAASTFPAAAEGLVAAARTAERQHDVRGVIDRVRALIEARPPDADLQPLLRALHLAMVRAEASRQGERYTAIGKALLERFPADDPLVSREIARTVAAMQTPGATAAIVRALSSAGVSREQQIFYANCLRTLRGGWESAERDALVAWFRRTQDERWRGGASFGGYIRQMWADSLLLFPPDAQRTAREAVPELEAEVADGKPVWRPTTAAYSEQELREYLEFDPMAYTGDPVKGRAAYEKAFCANCHRHGEIGTEAGPDLTDVARRFTRADIITAILEPSKTISDQWAAVEITTRARESVAGIITAETPDAVQVLSVSGQRLRIPKAEIVSRKTATVSPMPEGLLNHLSLQEAADLFAFLDKGVR